MHEIDGSHDCHNHKRTFDLLFGFWAVCAILLSVILASVDATYGSLTLSLLVESCDTVLLGVLRYWRRDQLQCFLRSIDLFK